MCQKCYDQNKVFLHEKVSVTLDKWEALCILMQYEIELMYTFGIITFYFICTIFSFTKWLLCWNLVMVRISL